MIFFIYSVLSQKSLHGGASSSFLGVIHGDYNEQNLLVARNNAKSDESPYEEHDIVGVIDFGDMAETCYVYEVITCTLFTPNYKGSFILSQSGGESEKDQRKISLLLGMNGS